MLLLGWLCLSTHIEGLDEDGDNLNVFVVPSEYGCLDLGSVDSERGAVIARTERSTFLGFAIPSDRPRLHRLELLFATICHVTHAFLDFLYLVTL